MDNIGNRLDSPEEHYENAVLTLTAWIPGAEDLSSSGTENHTMVMALGGFCLTKQNSCMAERVSSAHACFNRGNGLPTFGRINTSTNHQSMTNSIQIPCTFTVASKPFHTPQLIIWAPGFKFQWTEFMLRISE
jgi:hypothetical protein